MNKNTFNNGDIIVYDEDRNEVASIPVRESVKLTGHESVIICDGNANITVTLPDNCKDGQQLTILYSQTAGVVTIEASGSDVISSSSTNTRDGGRVIGNIILPKLLFTKSEKDAYTQDTETYKFYSFGVLLIYYAQDKVWIAGYAP